MIIFEKVIFIFMLAICLQQARHLIDPNEVQLHFLSSINNSNSHFYVLQSPRPERINNSLKFSNELGLSMNSFHYISFIDTVNYNGWNSDDIEKFRNNGTIVEKFSIRAIQNFLLGPLATHLSQIRAMESFLSSNFSNMILLEDDVIVNNETTTEHAMREFARMLNLNSTHWDIQFWGWCYECKPIQYPPHHFYTRAYEPLCSHAIVLSRTFVTMWVESWKPVWGNEDGKIIKMVGRFGTLSSICIIHYYRVYY
jgi:GR25 family glycosyltransferase involved in LPS biosynthesis